MKKSMRTLTMLSKFTNFMALSLLAFLASSPAVFASPLAQSDVLQTGVPISIDLSKTGSLDLARLRSYYAGASWETPISPSTWEKLKLLHVSKIRMINVESTEATHSSANERSMDFNFNSLNLGLVDCQNYKLTPHIVVGARIQTAIANRSTNGYFGVNNWSVYEDYAYELMKYVTVTRNFPTAEFEVGNEPDINGTKWLLEGKLPSGDARMYGEYHSLYRAWSNAAVRLKKNYPALGFKLGGPDITPYTFAFGKLNWASQFIDDAGKERLKLDFFSFHFYGNNAALDKTNKFGPYPDFDEEIKFYRKELKNAGLEKTSIYVSEWGPSTFVDGSIQGVTNGNHVGAAWAARFIVAMAENKIENALALIFRDHFLPNTREDNWGWPGYLLADGETPKALYNLFSIFELFPAGKLSVSRPSPALMVVSSSDGVSTGVMAVNQSWDFAKMEDLAGDATVDISLVGNNYKSDAVHVRMFVIDSMHADPYMSVKNGKAAGSSVGGLRPTAEFDVHLKNGVIQLPATLLRTSSVTFWQLVPLHQ
ncbi:hypothetical protein PQQ63_28930 [Paraburkholderia metrosideri]|uniref:Glycosyl hydrolases family 39 N-terminal catalytic domain-containing protein n=1 Tax=Paraburkholderia metrosideri TaxID=580937 RepID=A0ABW9E3J3_9BURK